MSGLANRMLGLLSRYSFGFALVLFIVFMAISLINTPNFGWTAQLGTFAPLAIAAMASTPAIISGGGGFDLSISPLMTFASILMVGWLIPHGFDGVLLVPAVILIGLAVGVANGVVVTRLRVPPVVATLAMYFILIGVDLKLAPVPKSLTESWISDLSGSFHGVPGGLLTIGLPLVVWFGLARTPYLGMLYSVGSNDVAAFSSGVNVDIVRIAAYGLGGAFAAIGGLALTALVSTADASSATAYTLIAIASIALGGTSLWGGRGGMIGSLLGAACIYLLSSLIGDFGVPVTWLQIIYGGVLLLAICLSGLSARRRPAW